MDLVSRGQRVSNRRFKEDTVWEPAVPNAHAGPPNSWLTIGASVVQRRLIGPGRLIRRNLSASSIAELECPYSFGPQLQRPAPRITDNDAVPRRGAGPDMAGAERDASADLSVTPRYRWRAASYAASQGIGRLQLAATH